MASGSIGISCWSCSSADGMGEIYRGREAGSSRDVSIKVLSAARALDPEAVARFRNEAALVQQLAHPHILPD